MATIHTFILDLDFPLANQMSRIDRFSAEWAEIERKEGVQSLKQLKSVATVQSVGASTRIEGSRMTNDEVKVLIFDNLKVDNLEERDQQEVVGYFQALDVISDYFEDIRVAEGDIKNLHNLLMKFSDKDQWHKGDYKQQSNSVEARYPDGTSTLLFSTASPGIETSEAMRALITWFNGDYITPPLIKVAAFVYEFLSIHPFQDGNGRLSRLLSTLLLLKQGYNWVQYISFESEIESRKKEYYQALMDCQQRRPGEKINVWVAFFLSCLGSMQAKLLQKLEVQKSENKLSPREKMIYLYVDNHPGARSGDVANSLKIPLPTVKRVMAEMTASGFLFRYGSGTGTNYTTGKLVQVNRGLFMKFTNEVREHKFLLRSKNSFIDIIKILLTPVFNWSIPDDWSSVLLDQNPVLTITSTTEAGVMMVHSYSIAAFINPFYFKPVFTLHSPIHIPAELWKDKLLNGEFPVEVKLEIACQSELVKFEILLVYDAVLD